MSIYLNDKDKLDIAVLKEYTGKDEVLQKLSELYQDVYARFFKHDLPVIFVHPRMKKGNKLEKNIPAISQETIPWVTYIKTGTGNMPIRYCDSAIPQQMGGFKFSPAGFHIIMQRWSYTKNDIDKVLVLMCTSHYKNGIIYILDDQADAVTKAKARSQSSNVAYHIFSEGGDLFSNEKQLNEFCLAWGISTKGKFIDQKRNELFDTIEAAQKRNDPEYGYSAFNAAITDSDPYFSIRVEVQDAINKNILRYDKNKYIVLLQNGETFLRIPIEKSDLWKNVLFEYLGKFPDKLETLTASNEGAPVHELRKVETPDEITEEFIMAQSYPTLKILVMGISGLTMKEMKTMKMPELQAQLIDYYVTKGLKRP